MTSESDTSGGSALVPPFSSKLPLSATLAPGFTLGGELAPYLEHLGIHTDSSDGLTTAHAENPASQDRHWMKRALRLATHALGNAAPNPAVGCVIVHEPTQRLLAEGHTAPYPGPHAEARALAALTAGDQALLAQSTLYVTLEPCAHTGRNPPCAHVIAQTALHRIVVARLDPNPLVAGRGLRALRAAGKWVAVGLMSVEASALNAGFISRHERGRMVVALKWAQTLDGQLADNAGTSRWITGPAARAYAHVLRQKYDALGVGAQTFLQDQPSLTMRHPYFLEARHPLIVLFDPKGRIAEAQDHLHSAASPIILLSPHRPRSFAESRDLWLNPADYAGEGTWICAALRALEDPRVHQLRKYPLQSLFIEGGAQLLRLVLEGVQADYAHVFIAPKLTGGQKNRIALQRALNEPHSWQMLGHHRLGNDVVIELSTPEGLALLTGATSQASA